MRTMVIRSCSHTSSYFSPVERCMLKAVTVETPFRAPPRITPASAPPSRPSFFSYVPFIICIWITAAAPMSGIRATAKRPICSGGGRGFLLLVCRMFEGFASHKVTTVSPNCTIHLPCRDHTNEYSHHESDRELSLVRQVRARCELHLPPPQPQTAADRRRTSYVARRTSKGGSPKPIF